MAGGTDGRGERNGRLRRWLVRIGIAALAVVILGVGALFVGAQLGERKMMRQVRVDARPVALREDAAGLERGRYLFMSRGCTECHGANGGGKVVVDDGHGMLVKAPDITSGSATVAKYGTIDWVRTIRHGIKPDGRPVIVMPSEDYARLTDADLGALVAWLRRMPSAHGGVTVMQLPTMVKALYAAGLIRDAAEKIDHDLPPPAPVAETTGREHGAYVANMCIGCHGPGFAGGRIPGTPPDWPPAADLRPGGPMKAYADARAFGAMLKTGKRPDGSGVSPVMPFGALKELNDVDVTALFSFLRGLPPMEVR